jgi:hypothetical protein
MTRDVDPHVRKEAVWAIVGFCRTDEVGLLQERLWDATSEVRTVEAMALSQLMPRRELENWMDAHLDRLSFEVLREFDFALYAPGWVKRSKPRAVDNDIRLELGMCRPDFASFHR